MMGTALATRPVGDGLDELADRATLEIVFEALYFRVDQVSDLVVEAVEAELEILGYQDWHSSKEPLLTF